jgi:hypothetical protein
MLVLCGAYLFANATTLRFEVYYRYVAAHDQARAAQALLGFVLQGAVFSLAATLLRSWRLALFAAICLVSLCTEAVYESIFSARLDDAAIGWLLAERRRGPSAIGLVWPTVARGLVVPFAALAAVAWMRVRLSGIYTQQTRAAVGLPLELLLLIVWAAIPTVAAPFAAGLVRG